MPNHVLHVILDIVSALLRVNLAAHLHYIEVHHDAAHVRAGIGRPAGSGQVIAHVLQVSGGPIAPLTYGHI